MKEAIVAPGPKVSLVDSPIPQPNDDQVLIQVVVSGSNPKDWKLPEWFGTNDNPGDDIAGIVHQVGKNVSEFKPGDRVFAFHEMRTPGGSYAEYAVAWQHTTAHIPANTSFEEAAAVPLAALTAAVGLYRHLQLPQPWTPATDTTPLVINGAASAVGIYVVQLAARASIHPLICVAGKSTAHVESFIDRSKGDVVIDYREGDDAVVEGIKKAAQGQKLLHAYDAVSENGSHINLGKALSPGATITTVLPTKDDDVSSNVRISRTSVGSVHQDDKDLGYVYMRFFAKGLQDGWFKAQPQEIVPGGLEGVQKALENLKAGKANAVKYVFRIADTK
ncbi:GroES-like protein [Cryphonectria parasitica EP155]|uniref:GroES-like protein n=1 Tax=Cryphonectria parasitica (strain ATCC 38755 / EP155) TaxID=660469 RepID=A0A9P4YDL5_CRYP1|nr:GroES-like protein [Cryphonectria parasitica EP155]KAF3771403.1 GroES-like protein [Cryphonectria parasitica EP155]